MRLGGQEVVISPGTLAEFLYGLPMPGNHAGLAAPGADGALHARERFRHRYEVDPEYVARLEAAGLVFSGRHPAQPIMQVLELPQVSEGAAGGPGHPYFIAAQFHPELTSRPARPQPLFMGLVAATAVRKHGPAEAHTALSQWSRVRNGQVQAV